jgi:hypothetical protein
MLKNTTRHRTKQKVLILISILVVAGAGFGAYVAVFKDSARVETKQIRLQSNPGQLQSIARTNADMTIEPSNADEPQCSSVLYITSDGRLAQEISQQDSVIQVYIMPLTCQGIPNKGIVPGQGTPGIQLKDLPASITDSETEVTVCTNSCDSWQLYVTSFRHSTSTGEDFYISVTGPKNNPFGENVSKNAVHDTAESIQSMLNTNNL